MNRRRFLFLLSGAAVSSLLFFTVNQSQKLLVSQDLRGGQHHSGATRMSASPQSGVVDSNLKVFGLENLFVTGSSVFPTNGWVNPTFTIIALSLRLTNHLDSLFRRIV